MQNIYEATIRFRQECHYGERKAPFSVTDYRVARREEQVSDCAGQVTLRLAPTDECPSIQTMGNVVAESVMRGRFLAA